MAKTIKEERLRWVLPIANKEVKLLQIAKRYAHMENEAWSAGWQLTEEAERKH